MIGSQKQIPPRLITHNNSLITKIKEITNIANEHFINKINNIINKFITNKNVTPIQILEYLIPKTKYTFKQPIPTINDVNNIIKKAKASNSTGNDIITMRVIKKETSMSSLHLIH